jgi:GDP-4-dehydro-6-deoxy-D-mannose reductase
MEKDEKRTILITGSEGFVGGHLIKVLEEESFEIVATCYPSLLPKKGDYVSLDIMNLEMSREVLGNHNPDIIFHLAAISSVSKSLRNRPLTYNTNIIGTVNLLDAARSLDKKVLFIFVSSCEIYGGGSNLDETSEIVLKNPLAVSKYAAELACKNYMIEGIDCVILRPFSHTGPKQAEDFVLSTIAKQIAEIEKGKRPPLLELGNTEIKREFMDVKDIVNAYKLAIEKCQPGETYNISSNKGYSLAEALEIFQKLSREKFEVKTDPTRIRKIDIPVLLGNGNKFSNLTGWQPKIKFGKTLEDLLNYWRAKI